MVADEIRLDRETGVVEGVGNVTISMPAEASSVTLRTKRVEIED